MKLSVLQNSEIPAYRQIFGQIAAQILSGELASGEALPPIRTVSRELAVSVITVRSAWDALEEAGLIETRAGSGCFVRALSDEERGAMRAQAVEKPLLEFIERAKSFGFGADEAQELLRRNW